ncbi:MAG TPA: DUF1707 domain-containing protein [Marmoricola sp.]|nr:DUF1707 domain-containing protein [Marmoricola sp.]
MQTGPDPDQLRIADTEREAAVASLGEHYAVGRLTREEYDQRCEAAWAARTTAELRPLFVDLPGPHQQPTRAPRRGMPPRVRSRWPVPLVAVLAILLGLSVLNHLPLVLLGLLAWFVLARGSRRW